MNIDTELRDFFSFLKRMIWKNTHGNFIQLIFMIIKMIGEKYTIQILLNMER